MNLLYPDVTIRKSGKGVQFKDEKTEKKTLQVASSIGGSAKSLSSPHIKVAVPKVGVLVISFVFGRVASI